MPAPPEHLLELMAADAATHPETGGWLIALEEHNEQLDACRGAKA